MTRHLQNEGHAVDVKRIRRLMRRMVAGDAAHGGQPPAVVCFNQIETDQQGQRVA